MTQHAGSHGVSGDDRLTPASIGASSIGHTHAGLGGASVWYSGAGVPSGGSGTVGDWYLNETNGDVYEKTGTSTWTLRDNLTGPQGAAGNRWYISANEPSGALGSVGDYLLRTSDGNIWIKTGESFWEESGSGSLMGPEGAKGDTGNTGATGSSGWAYGVVDGSPTLADSGTVTLGVTSGDRVFKEGMRIRCYGDATHYMEGIITSWVSPTMQFTADHKVGTGTITNPYVFLTGDRGATGATGSTGPTGPEGEIGPPSADMFTVFSTTTTAGADDKTLRYNNATPASVTSIYVDETDEHGQDQSSFLSALSLGDTLRIISQEEHEHWHLFTVTSVTDNGTYRTIAVTYISGGAAFNGGEALGLVWGRRGAAGQDGVGAPTGSILMYGGSSAPTGYLMCDGASLLRADYAALFTAIGTTFGSADGTHFNVPDLGQKFPRGWKTGDTLGAAAGADTHTHAAHAVHSHPSGGNTGAGGSHTHTMGASGAESGHTHSSGGNTGDGGVDHTHSVSGNTNAASAGSTKSGSTTSTITLSSHVHGVSLTSGAASAYTHAHTTPSTGASTGHTHSGSGNVGNESSHVHADPATANNASTQSHDTPSHLPSYVIVNYIIKT